MPAAYHMALLALTTTAMHGKKMLITIGKSARVVATLPQKLNINGTAVK